MTIYHNQTTLPYSTTTFLPMACHINEPEGKYSVSASSAPNTTIQAIDTIYDRLEQHFACYHFHHLSLIALSNSEACVDDWEFGAHLTGHALQKNTESLMAELSDYKLSLNKLTLPQ